MWRSEKLVCAVQVPFFCGGYWIWKLAPMTEGAGAFRDDIAEEARLERCATKYLLKLAPEIGQLAGYLFDARAEFGHLLFQLRDAVAEVGVGECAERA